MIYVITTGGSDRPLYRRDLMNVCCWATGEKVHFSYRKKWVEPVLLEAGNPLMNKEVILAFRQVQGNLLIDHPIRRGKITNVTPGSGTVSVEIQLGDFFDYSRDTASVDEALRRVRSSLHPAGAEPDKRMVVSRNSVTVAEDFPGTWLSTVAHMSSLPELANSVFFCVVAPDTDQVEPIGLTDGKVGPGGQGQIVIQGGASREISLRLYHGDGAAALPTEPEIVVRETVASVAGPFLRQDHAGVRADFIVDYRNTFEDQAAMMTVRMKTPGASATAPPVQLSAPEYQAYVKLTASQMQLVLVIVLLVVGALLVGFTKDVFETPSDCPNRPDAFACKNAFALAMGAKLVGALMLAGGYYRGFRRLPAKSS